MYSTLRGNNRGISKLMPSNKRLKSLTYLGILKYNVNADSSIER